MATDFWNGTGNWFIDNTLWSDGSPPVSTEGAEIQTGTDNLTSAATVAALQIDAPATLQLAANSALDLTGELTVNGTLANFGAVSGGGATEVAFGSGTDRLILGPGATFGGAVVGGGVNSTLELAAGTGAGTLNALGTTLPISAR